MPTRVESVPNVDLRLRVDAKTRLSAGVVELGLTSGRLLPTWEPGAHIEVQCGEVRRQYSLCGDPADRGTYRIAVLREHESRGGSSFIHDVLALDDVVEVSGPRNGFALVDAERFIFVAGGIGITPIVAMVRDAERRGLEWELHYGGRDRASMAYARDLAELGPRVRIYPQDEVGRLPLSDILGDHAAGTHVYCCGPTPLLDAFAELASSWPVEAVHVERFQPVKLNGAAEQVVEITLARRGTTVSVNSDQTLLAALNQAGAGLGSSCEVGTCGTCEVSVLEGVPDHRDSVLTPQEREANAYMMPCVSRALTPHLVLDI